MEGAEPRPRGGARQPEATGPASGATAATPRGSRFPCPRGLAGLAPGRIGRSPYSSRDVDDSGLIASPAVLGSIAAGPRGSVLALLALLVRPAPPRLAPAQPSLPGPLSSEPLILGDEVVGREPGIIPEPADSSWSGPCPPVGGEPRSTGRGGGTYISADRTSELAPSSAVRRGSLPRWLLPWHRRTESGRSSRGEPQASRPRVRPLRGP